MIDNGFEEKIDIKYSEIDSNLALKPFYLLNFLQDIAGNNAEHLGFGYSYMHPKNLMWFIIKYHMEFSDYPTDVQELTLKTQPRGYNKLFAYRDFEFWNKEICVGRINSMWAIVDTETKSMVLPQTAIPDNPRMQPYEKKEDDLAFSKIRVLENPVAVKEFEVRYNDLDLNGHANNGNYIVWALETLNHDFRFNHKIKTLDIIYKKEAVYGEKLVSEFYKKDENTTVHVVKNKKGEDLCLVECSWM